MILSMSQILEDANRLLKRRDMTFVLAGTVSRATLTLVDQNYEQTIMIEGNKSSIKTYLAAFTTGFRIGATK